MPRFGKIPLSEVRVTTPGAGAAGQGTTNTKIRRFTVADVNTGSAITYADSAANGASFTINENGLYSIGRVDNNTAGATFYGASLNASGAQLTTAVSSIAAANQLPMGTGPNASGYYLHGSCIVRLAAGDVVRPHDGGTVPNQTASVCMFHIIKIGR